MHLWGDNGVDWKGIDDAASYIGKFCRKWGRINVRDYKEKFGSVRVYCGFGWYDGLHSITHPGYAYIQYPKWLINLNYKYFIPLISLLNRIVVPYQNFIYRLAYKRAIKKWPHLKEEIICDADYDFLLLDLHDKPTFDEITTVLTEMHQLESIVVKKNMSIDLWRKVSKWLQLKRYNM